MTDRTLGEILTDPHPDLEMVVAGLLSACLRGNEGRSLIVVDRRRLLCLERALQYRRGLPMSDYSHARPVAPTTEAPDA